jgi:hypothetical protein
MAVSRPNVVVYQEYSALSIIADTPEMEVLVVGPCYQILDYLDDKDDCYADDYGTLEGLSPAAATTAVTIASPPGLQPGGLLEADSVKVFLDVARAILVNEADGTNVKFVNGSNYFESYSASAGADFVSSGVAVGDILLANLTQTTAKVATITAVRVTLCDPGATYAFLQGNGTYGALAEGDIVTISDDTYLPVNGESRDGVYTIKSVRSNTIIELEGTNAANWMSLHSGLMTTETFTMRVTASNGIPRTGYSSLASVALYNETCVRVTTDFATSPSVTYGAWRVERQVSDVELDATDITTVDNVVTVAGAITIDLSSTLTGKTVTYGKLYMEYKALRTDLQQPISYQSTNEMLAALGKYDARNPLAVGAVVAKANTSTSVKVYGLAEDNTTGYQTFLDNISSVREIYAIVPLTTDTSILAMIKQDCEQLADPNYVLTAGIRQKFRACIGSVVKPVTKTVSPVSGSATTEQITLNGDSGKRTLTLTSSGTLGFSFTAAGHVVLPGDIVVATINAVETRYTVAQVLSATVVEVDPDGPAVTDVTLDTSPVATLKVLQRGTTSTERVHAVTASDANTIIITGSAMAKLYLTLKDTTATFVTAGILPGDIIEMPTNPDADFATTTESWIVATVESQTRLTVQNIGRNTPVLANELPHAESRDGSGTVTQGYMYYKVIRTMSKDQQVDDMVAVATSFASKRTLLCYPDSVVVTDLVDGSLSRTDSDTPEAAAAQPGYYLSCAVGGQTAGQPTQQGFTNLGVAGITSISGSSGYFKETQLTELSNGGIYVFVQDNPSSLPYSIHEVTTDVSSLEFGEYMVTKNFDYISLTFLDSMLPFIGRWNLLPITLDYMRDGLNQVGTSLKKRVVAKVGAPLTSYEIVSVAASDISSDRAEAYINVNLPMTLNTIGLHLVA